MCTNRTERRLSRALAIFALQAAACQACESSGGRPTPAVGVLPGTLTVTSPAFSANGHIPVDLTCDGADKSPRLAWSAPPSNTKSFAVVVDDPDAPGGTFTHWIAYNIPKDALALPEDVDLASIGAIAANNDFERPGYSGPCPPRNEIHRYFFRVYALDAVLAVQKAQSRSAVFSAMHGHVVGEGALVGTFFH
ncbi:MAG TPA: YbhB/YbcL family Raf kinase inhibitor-like protein [Polyangiaceae bacterium]